MTLPAATKDLDGNSGLTLSGTDITDWGDATGGVAPTYSNTPADQILGYGVAKFDGAEYLTWNAIASMFSGDDPEFTAALVFRPRIAGGAKTIVGGGAASGPPRFEVARVSGTPTLVSNRRDGTSSSGSVSIAGSGEIAYGNEYMVLIKQDGGTRSGMLHRISDGLEVSDSASVNVASTTMTVGGIGADVSGGSVDQFWTGDIARIRLYDSALTGDLTGDLTGTQLGQLKEEMLQQAGGTLDPSILKYGMILDDSTLKPGLVNETYTTGTGTSDTLKPGVLDSDGNLKPGILDADGNIKPGALR